MTRLYWFNANQKIATALGALRAREAVPALAKLTTSRDPFTQVAAIDALGAVGDPAGVDALLAVVNDEQGEPFAIKKALLALGRIGDARAVSAVRRMLYVELATARACAGAVACWAGKLSDPLPEVRGRAALEVGGAGGAAQAGALTEALVKPVQSDAELAARYHAVLGLDWLSRRVPLGAQGAELAGAIDKMVAGDKGRTLTAAVNEDSLRLAGRLRRAGP